MIEIIVAGGIAIALIPPVVLVVWSCCDRVDMSPQGRMKLTHRYLKECKAFRNQFDELKTFEFIEDEKIMDKTQTQKDYKEKFYQSNE